MLHSDKSSFSIFPANILSFCITSWHESKIGYVKGPIRTTDKLILNNIVYFFFRFYFHSINASSNTWNKMHIAKLIFFFSLFLKVQIRIWQEEFLPQKFCSRPKNRVIASHNHSPVAPWVHLSTLAKGVKSLEC